MRTVLVAALMLSPIMLHAQANSPAKTQASNEGYTLQAKLTMPEELAPAAASDFDDVPANSPLIVTTGVVAPRIIRSVDVTINQDPIWRFSGKDKKVVISMTVDKTGKPSNLKIDESAGDELDQDVLNAVSQYRFKPGTLNNQPTEVPVKLEIIVKAPTI
jgi:TonB family protein